MARQRASPRIALPREAISSGQVGAAAALWRSTFACGLIAQPGHVASASEAEG